MMRTADDVHPACEAPWREQLDEGWQTLQTRTCGDVLPEVIEDMANKAGGVPLTAFVHDDLRDVTSLAGKRAWLCPSVDVIKEQLCLYRRLKAASPHDTSACIMVPKWYGVKWRSQLCGMKLLHTYERGSKLFGGARQEVGERWEWEVWFDPPSPRLRFAVAARQKLTMQMVCSVSGCKGMALADSGASDVFVSRLFAEHAGLRFKSAHATEVTLGGQHVRHEGLCDLHTSVKDSRIQGKGHGLCAGVYARRV